MQPDPSTDRPIPLAALNALAAMHLGQSADETLRELCRVSLDVIARGDAASVTVLDGNDGTTFGATDELATRADDAQYRVGAGPCLEAAFTNTPVLVVDLRDQPRWASGPAMVDAGVRSSLSLPLVVGGSSVGSLNLYSTHPRGLDETSVEVGAALASYAAVAVANAVSFAGVADRAAQLQTAMQTRAVIEQAKGIVMSTTGLDADAAFNLLVQQSQHENRKVRDIAVELVARAELRGRKSRS